MIAPTLTLALAGFLFEKPMMLDEEYLASWVRAMVRPEDIVELGWSAEATFDRESIAVRLGRRGLSDFVRADVAIEPGITAIYLLDRSANPSVA